MPVAEGVAEAVAVGIAVDAGVAIGVMVGLGVGNSPPRISHPASKARIETIRPKGRIAFFIIFFPPVWNRCGYYITSWTGKPFSLFSGMWSRIL
jgi:hypothetical protein